MPDLPVVDTNYRTVNIPSDQGQTLSFNRGAASDVAGSVPNPNDFGNQLVGMLQQYQRGFQDTANTAQRNQALRTAGSTPGLEGANPALQSLARSSAAQALEPTIGGARAAITEAGDAISRLQQLQQQKDQFDAQHKAEAKQNIDLLIQTGTAADIAAYLASDPDSFKGAGYEPKVIAGILPGLKIREQREAAQFARSMSGGGSSPSATDALFKDVPKDIQDNYLVAQNSYNIIRTTLGKYSMTPETIMSPDGRPNPHLKDLTNEDADTIGTNLFLLKNPQSVKNPTPGAAENFFSPNSALEKGQQAFQRFKSGKKYLDTEVASGIATGASNWRAQQNLISQYNGQQSAPTRTPPPGDGATKVYNRVTYKVVNGTWVPQKPQK